MATLEEREIVDYTIKKLESILDPENFVIKDLDKMHNRIKKQEERLKGILRKINRLENRIRDLENQDSVFETESSSSE